MAAEPSRRSSKSSGLLVRPQAVSDKSYVESVVGFINEVVPQSKPGEKESIVWVKFEYCDINDFSLINEDGDHNVNNLPLLLILGYSNGVQIWSIPGNGEAQEVLSWRQGPVKILRILSTPQADFSIKDKFSLHRPLVALCDSSSSSEQFCSINFVSLKSGDRIDGLKFASQVSDIKCNKRVFVVVFAHKIQVYDVCNFKELFTITSCYPTTNSFVNPIALGTRWLAFADHKLVSLYQTCGGMAGDGVQSYAATVIHAAKTITKGLTMFGETVANSITGHKPSMNQALQKSDPRLNMHAGIVTILDVLAVNSQEVNLDEDSAGDGIVAHFPAHANEPVAAMSFDPSGMLLITSCRLGHNFNVFRIFPHPASSTLGAVHHLYTLHRGDTSAKVQDIAFSLDSRWVAVSTLRGTTHIFPITPYGGQVSVRTHTSPRVVNRLSRFHRSAGLEEMQHSSQTGRNSPVLSGSPGTVIGPGRELHPSMPYPSSSFNRMGNSRLPPYPHPVTVHPLAQLKQAVVFSLTSGGKPKSPSGKDRFNKRTDSGSENICVAAAFAPPRAWLVSSPSLTRDKREKLPMDSLFVIDWHGNLIEYLLEPKPATGMPKTDDSPIELDVNAHAQWNLVRPTCSPEFSPPLPSNNPLLFTTEPAAGAEVPHKEGNTGEFGFSSCNINEKQGEVEESWLSQVEIITHAGPHRRLWMGPQFTFQTFQHHSNTTVLSSTSSALLSQSPDAIPPSATDIFTEELNIQSLSARPARSNPMAMPRNHQGCLDFPGSPLLIEASSGSFEQLPNMLEVCGSWPDGCATVNHCKGREEQLKENIADAMAESPFDVTLTSVSRSDTAEFHGSYEELSSSSSHSGSVGHFNPRNSSPHSMEQALIFPSSGGSPDSC